MAQKDIEANGWHNLRRDLRLLLFLGIISSVIGGLAVVIYLSGYSKSEFWLSQAFDLPLGLVALIIYMRWPMSYSRGFELPFERTFELIEANTKELLPEGRLSAKWSGSKVLKGVKTRVTLTREMKGQTGIIVSTPRGQEERNLRLREAVTAVLEGRSPVSSRLRPLGGHTDWHRSAGSDQAAGLAVEGKHE